MSDSASHESPSWSQRGDDRPRIIMLGAGDRENVAEQAGHLRSTVERYADVVCFDMRGETDLSQFGADFAVVLGGDGSMLRTAQQMHARQLPVLGVNMGKLGYLASVSPDDLDDAMAQVVSGQCRIVSHLMLRSQIIRAGEVVDEATGLNESAILSGPPFRILNVDLYVDSKLATTYSCDGLIISTPVGSTAHSLSAGGPILRNNLRAVVVQPISPHTLTVRPVVDSSDRVFEAVVENPNEGTTLVVDGRVVARLQSADCVRTERASCDFLTIELLNQNYYRTLREKLGWGGMIRR